MVTQYIIRRRLTQHWRGKYPQGAAIYLTLSLPQQYYLTFSKPWHHRLSELAADLPVVQSRSRPKEDEEHPQGHRACWCLAL